MLLTGAVPLGLLLAGCGAAGATPQPTPSPATTATPTSVATAQATSQALQTATPRPAVTAISVGTTAVTATPRPTAASNPSVKALVWTAANVGLYGGRTPVLAVSPAYAQDRTLFAGTFHDGVFRSTDGGGSWIAANKGLLPDVTVYALAVSPAYAQDHTLFAGTYNGVFRSEG